MKYRKKPVEVVALKVGGTFSWAKLASWCGGQIITEGDGTRKIAGISINTLEGNMLAREGDWIIKDVAGEFYPCKDDIFKATYEAVK